ncbi:unnamed protein product [Ranitomeya imitator]|uniref:non-specific serine/threonine protein kinase n=1 Tax=Ranitomeya imitator TaxID=111125 RepID=A0ABN9MN29_9NEOB|nr:unnamed protein product [Ranitomeya imitator]
MESPEGTNGSQQEQQPQQQQHQQSDKPRRSSQRRSSGSSRTGGAKEARVSIPKSSSRKNLPATKDPPSMVPLITGREQLALESEVRELQRKKVLIRVPTGEEVLRKIREDRAQDGNQGKHQVTKRGPALSYPMFTLVTGIVGRWRAVCVTALQRPNSDAAAIWIVVGIAAASLSVTESQTCRKTLTCPLEKPISESPTESVLWDPGRVCRKGRNNKLSFDEVETGELPYVFGSMEFSDDELFYEDCTYSSVEMITMKERTKLRAEFNSVGSAPSTPVEQKTQVKQKEDKENSDAKLSKNEGLFLHPAPWTPVTKKGILTTPNTNVLPPGKEKNSAKKETPIKKVIEASGDMNPSISPERRCRSVDLDLNQAHLDGAQKKKGTKVFGSLERGLDKVITMLTPSKRKGYVRDGPRKLRAHYNVTMTNMLSPDLLLNEIVRVLPQKNVDYVQKGYTLKCKTQSDFGKVTMQFELEVCQVNKPDLVGIRRQRLKGDAWVYKRLVEDILSSCKVTVV